MTAALVTGADGFIGSHLVEHLLRDGYEVRALVQYNSFGHWGWLDSIPEKTRRCIEVVASDIRDPYAMMELVKGCDLVFHLAALIAIPYSYHAPMSYVETNVVGTLNLLEAARRAEIGRFIHTSTSEVYGTATRVPIDETHQLNAQSPYAASKTAADQMALAYHASYGLPVIVLRPFNTYGPRQSARAVIPTIISQLIAGAKTIKLGATHPTRDFNFVADTCAAFIAAAKATDKNAVGRSINAGSNFEISIGDTATLIAEILGVDLSIETDSIRLRPSASEVERLWADNTLARDLLGWSPKFGGRDGLRRGLAETIEWFRQPGNQRLYKAGIYAV